MNNQDRLIIEKEQLNDLVNSCQEEIRTLKEENQRLKEQIRKYKDLDFEHLCKENQRLNNVLNELEKWLKDKQNLVCGCGITADYIYAYETVLDYLNELKESDK